MVCPSGEMRWSPHWIQSPAGDQEGVAVTGGSVDLVEGRRRVAALVAEGHPRTEAAKLVARETGLGRRDLFREPGQPGGRP